MSNLKAKVIEALENVSSEDIVELWNDADMGDTIMSDLSELDGDYSASDVLQMDLSEFDNYDDYFVCDGDELKSSCDPCDLGLDYDELAEAILNGDVECDNIPEIAELIDKQKKLSDLVENVNKMMAAMTEVWSCAEELGSELENVFNNKYPFDKSIEEMVTEVMVWHDAIVENLE